MAGRLEPSDQVVEVLDPQCGVRLASGTELRLDAQVDADRARKAHPALRVEDLDDLVGRLESAGYEVREEGGLDGFRQRYVDDPFGNRIELLEPMGGSARE